MTGKAKKAPDAATVRVLSPDDLDAVVAIDQEESGRSRRGFYEKNLNAVQGAPESYITLGADRGGALAGYVILRLSAGEFGDDHARAVIEALGVGRAHRDAGVGRSLLTAAEEKAIELGARELASEADWSRRGLLGFLEHAGFGLAPNLLLERPVSTPFDV
ncbi:MAG: GNAT family N-acetyltransferase [Bauldia litoralis]